MARADGGRGWRDPLLRHQKAPEVARRAPQLVRQARGRRLARGRVERVAGGDRGCTRGPPGY